MSAQNSIFSVSVLPKKLTISIFHIQLVLIRNERTFLTIMKIRPDFPDWPKIYIIHRLDLSKTLPMGSLMVKPSMMYTVTFRQKSSLEL